MSSAIKELETKVVAARVAAKKLARLSSEVKNKALLQIAENLVLYRDEIMAENQRDRAAADEANMSAAMQDRLMLNTARIASIAMDVKAVAGLPDPVGEIFDMRTLPNGLQISRKRVPLGVIATIYESRPNVTVDISALSLKSGNAVILRGGKEAIHSNLALAKVVQRSAYEAGVPEGAIQIIESTDRAVVDHMLKMSGAIDLIVPRGGAELIKFVASHATMPVLAGGVGVCHTYIDKSAKLNDAVAIVYNAKVQRPTVCNGACRHRRSFPEGHRAGVRQGRCRDALRLGFPADTTGYAFAQDRARHRQGLGQGVPGADCRRQGGQIDR